NSTLRDLPYSRMRQLLILSIFLPLICANGIFSHIFDDLDQMYDDDFPAVRPIRPVERTSKYMRRVSTSDESDEPRIVKSSPVRAFSSDSGFRPRSVSSVDQSVGSPVFKFLDTAQDLFSNLFSMFPAREFTVSVDRPDPEDIRSRLREKDDTDKEGSGETSVNAIRPLNDDELRLEDVKAKAVDRFASFFEKIGASAFANSHLTGPHICVRELNKKVLEPSKTKKSFRECKRFEKAVRCIERQTDKKGGLESTRIQECCDGFDTDNISDEGCNRESLVMSARDVLSLANSSMVDLLDELGLASVLDGPEKYTIIVPPNAAIERIQRSSYTELRNLLSNHILDGDLRDYEMVDGSEFSTQANSSVTVVQRDIDGRQKTLVNCVPLTTTNVRTSSGTIHHVSDSIGLSSSTILEYLEESNRFKTFVSLITPDLERKLRSTDGEYTVFAFSDGAFAALSESVRTNIISKSACVKDLIINHIVNGTICSSQLEDRTVTSLGGEDLRVHTMVGANDTHMVHIGTAKLVEPDRFTSNGVVHVIDDVILLENLLTWRDHLLTFNEPLLTALSSLSMDSEPLTIFVPPYNSSMGSLDMDVFALNHVAENQLVLNPTENQNVTTVTNSTFFVGLYKNRSPISVRINSDSALYRTRPVIGCSRIVNQSIHACSSVLHFIDKPLPIIEGDLKWLFSTRQDLKRFHALWKASDVVELMDTTSPITVFPPSDDAMSRNQYNALLKNTTMINQFVRRYIVKGPLCSFDLRTRANEIKYDLIPNEADEILKSDTFDGELHINGARVQEEEIVLSNGIVHILETPILNVERSRSMPISFSDILGLTTRMLSK
ncbi:hypothetical protein PENTCL1PPCAC_5835, partial [Pristionchus entomophagus]